MNNRTMEWIIVLLCGISFATFRFIRGYEGIDIFVGFVFGVIIAVICVASFRIGRKSTSK